MLWNYQAARAYTVPLLFKCTRGIETLHVIKYDDDEWKKKLPAGNNINGFSFFVNTPKERQTYDWTMWTHIGRK